MIEPVLQFTHAGQVMHTKAVFRHGTGLMLIAVPVVLHHGETEYSLFRQTPAGALSLHAGPVTLTLAVQTAADLLEGQRHSVTASPLVMATGLVAMCLEKQSDAPASTSV